MLPRADRLRLFSTAAYFATYAPSGVLGGAAGIGASVAALYPTVITAYSRQVKLPGRRFGAIAVASCLGSMTFPWLIGRLLDIGGPVVVPATTAVLLATAFVATWVFLGRRTSAEGQQVL